MVKQINRVSVKATSCHLFRRTLLVVLATLTVVLSASMAHADYFDVIDRMRLLNQNIVNKPWPAKENVGPCGDDNDCRARLVAKRIKEGDYDVVVFEEQFDDASMDELIDNLGDDFPYYIGQFEMTPIAHEWIEDYREAIAKATVGGILDPGSLAAWDALLGPVAEHFLEQNSGIAIFSKWPITGFPQGSGAETIGWVKMDDKTAMLDAPASFVMFDECYNPLGGTPSPFWLRADDNAEHVSDCFASKGVGAVRLLSPTGRHFNVFFTHTQASYSGLLEDTAKVRMRQFEQVNQLMADLQIDTVEEEVLLVGDLNVNGNQVQLADDKVTDKNWEWHRLFDKGMPGTNAPFFKALFQLSDSWPYAMYAHYEEPFLQPDGTVGIDPGLTWTKESVGGSVNGRLDYVFLGRTSSPRRISMAVHHTAVSYNIGDVPSGKGAQNHGITSATSPGLKVYGAEGRISDHWGLSAEIAPATGFHNPWNASQIDPSNLCEDHNQCLPDPTDPTKFTCKLSKQDCVEDMDCDCLQSVFHELEQPGTAHWYRIDSPGTYAFRVNHIQDLWAIASGDMKSADNGLHYEVYLPSDLSRPYDPFGDLETTVKPGGDCNPKMVSDPDPSGPTAAGCTFVSSTYAVREAPFYVKVWYQADDWQQVDYPLSYDFTWQRNDGESADQALALKPSEELDGYRKEWSSTSGHERWYAIKVDRTDSGELQRLRFSAMCPIYQPPPSARSALASLSVIDADQTTVIASTDSYAIYDDGADVLANFRMFSGNNLPYPESASVGMLDADNKTYYLLLRRNPNVHPPETFDYQVRWDTDLTWYMDSKHAYNHSDAKGITSWQIYLNGETQDNWPCSSDEISLDWQLDQGHPSGLNFVDMDVDDDEGDLPVVLGSSVNVWGEPVMARRGVRYVQSFRARIREWDDWFNGYNDVAPWGKVGPMFRGDLQGPPDPATANHFIERLDVKIGWGSDDGEYHMVANRANSAPVQFCLTKPECANRAQCCAKQTVCVETEDSKDDPGGACNAD